ncbi:cyclohexadienyl dehydratase [Modicisalibacter muralis]|uniref:Cyclohexadienyl dehydratase n=1 Tax=Modicisalibacter muralis TaxID=119000 RepID=A0A1G9QC21_9GAMM|nr:transporter substrate-binding domain-containing protein [Halomonas muralis]SDM08566.1 cyclohexadienyl dehydratase [Halomonas muralis]
MTRTLSVLATLTLLAAAPLQAAEPSGSRSHLDQVLKQGVVRVCTTGDYKPFTYLDPQTEKFEGIDIDMAKDLAEALGVEAEFVPTSWPTLMQDFTAGKCDIAMGGISVNLDRQQKAYFSIPYFKGGKTPITRCENVDKFQTLEQIDRPGVTAIVNPGGTNERFARANLDEAEIVMYDDNVTIFKQIVAGEADLMMTDAIETVLQANLNPELCAVHPEAPFTYSEKGYLLPRGDEVWKAWVDQWLHLTKATGEFDAIKDKWLE